MLPYQFMDRSVILQLGAALNFDMQYRADAHKTLPIVYYEVSFRLPMPASTDDRAGHSLSFGTGKNRKGNGKRRSHRGPGIGNRSRNP